MHTLHRRDMAAIFELRSAEDQTSLARQLVYTNRRMKQMHQGS